MARIEVVGISLDVAAGLSVAVKKLIKKATILIGSSRHLSYFPEHPATKIVLSNLDRVIENIYQYLTTEHNIVILVSGDPLFFGLGRLLLEKLPVEQLSFHPNLSSIQLAFSRLKLPWQDAKIISIHGRSPDELIKLLQQGEAKIAILTDTEHNPSAIARLYLALDLPTFYCFWVCENLGSEAEKITLFAAENINQLANLTADAFAPLNIVILLHQEGINKSLIPNSLPLLGIPDSAFLSFRDRPGLMTKREIRIAILGELALQPKQIVWDIGAGTGSVAIEIARLCPTSQVYAIEKTAIGQTLIEQNCQRLQVNNVVVARGNAPEILSQLPAPDRIFIGGSGGNLAEILDLCQKKINPEGLLVIALATLENLYQSLDWFPRHSWQYRLLQLQISRSTPVGSLTRFTPLNPVTIITAFPTHSKGSPVDN